MRHWQPQGKLREVQGLDWKVTWSLAPVVRPLDYVGIVAQVWHYGTCVVLDGNSLWWQITIQALRKKKKIYTQVHFNEATYTCGLDVPKMRMRIHALSRKEKCVHVGKLMFWFVVFSPWYLNLWFWTMVSHQRCWSQVLGSWYCFYMVLDHGIERSLTYIRRISLGKKVSKEWMSDEVGRSSIAGYRFVMLGSGWIWQRRYK